MAKKRKWIQKAVNPKNKGDFTAYCKMKGFNGVTMECIDMARKSGNKHLIGMANFAANMMKINK